ncbi:DNA-binding transcriptional ArsR family regulator [Streptomyces tendae]
MPDADDLPETFHVTTDEQLRAVSNLTRHRIMAVLRFEPATITQIAERVGLAKGSSSYHVRLLERAGLVKVVRTRKVRGASPSGTTRWRHAGSCCRTPVRGRRMC